MAEATPDQSQTFMLWFMVLLLFTVFPYSLLAPSVRALCEPVGNDPANPAVKESAKWVVFVWVGASLSLAFGKPRDVQVARRLLRIAVQLSWSFGCALLLLHIAIAFHLGHGWSHEAAWEHTKQVGGYGDGIYVNYVFALVWFLDAVWLCVAYDSYFSRPRWLHWTIHGFLAFVVFNAAVVFGSWQSRKWLALQLLFLFAFLVLLRLAKLHREREHSTRIP